MGRDEAKLEAVVGRLASRAHAVVCDVADPASVDGLREALKGTEVSILVNNAGIAGPVAALTDISVEEWDEVFDVNVRGTFLMPRTAPGDDRTRCGRRHQHRIGAGKRPLAHRLPTPHPRWPSSG